MNPTKWILVERDFRSAARHFQMAAAIHGGEAGEPGEGRMGTYVLAGAFMHAVQSGHTSLEAGLLRIFKTLGESPPLDVDNWHEATVDQAFTDVPGRGTVLPPELFADVAETRRARNLAAKGYDRFDMGAARATAMASGRLALALPDALSKFIRRIDPQRAPYRGPGS